MFVHEIMTRYPVTITPDTRQDVASAMMRRNRFRHLPVVEGNALLGVISDRDLQRAAAGGIEGGEPIRSIVSSPAITAPPDTLVERAAGLLQENKIGCLPVVAPDERGGKLVGMVTESDIFAALIRSMGVLDPGSRIAVHLHDPLADLLSVSLALHTTQVPLRSMSTEPLLPSAHEAQCGVQPLRLTLLLGTIDPRQLVAALHRQYLTVEYPLGHIADSARSESGQPNPIPTDNPAASIASDTAPSAVVGHQTHV